MPEKTFTLAELQAEAKVFIGELDAFETADAAASLDWLFRSLDPNKTYTTGDLKNVLAVLESSFKTLDEGK